MKLSAKDVASAAVGAAAALGADRAAARLNRRTEIAAAGLLTAAAIYPAARRRSFGDGREKAVLVAAAAVVTAALTQPGLRGRWLLAAGWLAHAGFDAKFAPHADSRIPSWYPAMCAGYDAALAARLLI
jgi:hypothetical protein